MGIFKSKEYTREELVLTGSALVAQQYEITKRSKEENLPKGVAGLSERITRIHVDNTV